MEIIFYRKMARIGNGKGINIPKEMHELIEDEALYKVTLQKVE